VVLGEPIADRPARRRQATEAEIAEAAAWEVVREKGLAGLSLADMATRVGMRIMSRHSYFAPKNDKDDTMFAQGNDEFLAVMTARLTGLRRQRNRPSHRQANLDAHIWITSRASWARRRVMSCADAAVTKLWAWPAQRLMSSESPTVLPCARSGAVRWLTSGYA
jgi:AcrR family transcriptional regulator